MNGLNYDVVGVFSGEDKTMLGHAVVHLPSDHKGTPKILKTEVFENNFYDLSLLMKMMK